MKLPVGNSNLNTIVDASGVVMDETALKNDFRALATPAGGKIILSKLALMSADVNGLPSWNLTPD